MSIITVILFFLYTYGFGFTALYLLRIKQSEDAVERQIMRIGIGICVFIVVAVLLNLLNIPLHWIIFLLLSNALVAYTAVKERKQLAERWKQGKFRGAFTPTRKNIVYFFLLTLFLFNLYTYAAGSFAYEYLEDDDPWTHAREMKYVATEKTLDVGYFRPINYLDPYPPAYASLMGVLHQTSPEAQWTLKFFNSLIISLSIVFFFFFAYRLTGSRTISLASTFILSMIPSYLSHFIWSHSLVPLVFIILIYSYLMLDSHDKWWFITALITATAFLTHHRQVIKIGIMAVLFIAVLWYYRKKVPWAIIKASVAGFVISLAWWAFKLGDMLRMLTHETVGSGTASETAPAATAGVGNLLSKVISRLPSMFSPTGGTATRAYSFNDFFIAQKSNMINSPIGWGIAISLLLAAALIIILIRYKNLKSPKNYWIPVVVLWLIFTFLGVNSATFNLPIGFGAFRMWMLLALPVSILCGYGIVLLANLFKSSMVIKGAVLIILLGAVFATGGYYKYYHNINPGWPPGGKWTSMEELNGYVWMKNNLPLNSNVFTASVQNKVVFGFNMNSCVWCDWYREFHPTVLEQDVDTLYHWLTQHDFDYVAFGGMEVKYLGRTYGEAETQEKINALLTEMGQRPAQFRAVHQTQGFILVEIL